MLPLWNDASGVIRVVQQTWGSDLDALDTLIRLFEAVADEEGWQPGNAIRLWPSRSVYFALTLNDVLAGGLQIVLPDSDGRLPCFDLWHEVAPSKVVQSLAHIAILALDEPFRGRGILFWHLAVEMWRYCVAHGITTVFIEVTPRILPLYRRLGWPLVIQGELRTHWGEPCYLCSLGIPEVAEVLLRRAEDSEYYRQIISQAFRIEIVVSSGDKMAVTDLPVQAIPG